MADLSDGDLDRIEANRDAFAYRRDIRALVAEVRRLRRMERIKDRVGLDLDAQLSEVIAERDRLRDGLRELAGLHDGHDVECERCQARRLLDDQEDDR